jgi:hypothetical protein
MAGVISDMSTVGQLEVLNACDNAWLCEATKQGVQLWRWSKR